MGGDIEVARMIAYDAGKEDERAAIVAWLTEQADKRLQIADADGALELNLAANAIERGDHLKAREG